MMPDGSTSSRFVAGSAEVTWWFSCSRMRRPLRCRKIQRAGREAAKSEAEVFPRREVYRAKGNHDLPSTGSLQARRNYDLANSLARGLARV